MEPQSKNNQSDPVPGSTLADRQVEKPESGLQASITARRDAKSKKRKMPRTFSEILEDVRGPEPKSGSPIDRYVGLLLELQEVKDLNADHIQHFFASVNERLEEAWTPFLTKAALNVNPNKTGIERAMADEIRKCCEDAMENCGLSVEELQRAFHTFCDTKNEAVIAEYLRDSSRVDPAAAQPWEGMSRARKITEQELACVSYAYLILALRAAYPTDYKALAKLDRAVAEHFGKINLREQAGKTIGTVISSRQYSPKRIGNLTYLYAGTSEVLRQQSRRIQELENIGEQLRTRNTELGAELGKWKGSHADSVRRIEVLEKECARLRKELEASENMLEFERNRFQRQIQSKDAGLAKLLSKKIGLEIQAIRETAEYVDKENQHLIYRRLQRIDDILKNFGGNADV